jgi:hypothetical protein
VTIIIEKPLKLFFLQIKWQKLGNFNKSLMVELFDNVMCVKVEFFTQNAHFIKDEELASELLAL